MLKKTLFLESFLLLFFHSIYEAVIKMKRVTRKENNMKKQMDGQISLFDLFPMEPVCFEVQTTSEINQEESQDIFSDLLLDVLSFGGTKYQSIERILAILEGDLSDKEFIDFLRQEFGRTAFLLSVDEHDVEVSYSDKLELMTKGKKKIYSYAQLATKYRQFYEEKKLPNNENVLYTVLKKYCSGIELILRDSQLMKKDIKLETVWSDWKHKKTWGDQIYKVIMDPFAESKKEALVCSLNQILETTKNEIWIERIQNFFLFLRCLKKRNYIKQDGIKKGRISFSSELKQLCVHSVTKNKTEEKIREQFSRIGGFNNVIKDFDSLWCNYARNKLTFELYINEKENPCFEVSVNSLLKLANQ